jgi:hypothetical protein
MAPGWPGFLGRVAGGPGLPMGQVGVWDWSQVAQVFPWGQVGSRACKITQTVKAI